MKSKDIKKKLRQKSEQKILTAKDFLSTGSTPLNLACTGYPDRGFAMGHYYYIVGDSRSGKTWLSLTCLAEASINSVFDNHRFIFDNVENGALMNIQKYFGKKVFDRIEWPASHPSFTIEEFYFNVANALKAKKPFIYILDSMDSVSSKAEGKKFNELKNAFEKGKETTGSYGDGKAKVNSSMLRRVIGQKLEKSKSILIIINQTRDKMNAGIFDEKKTHSGGHALTFYASLEMWSSVAKKIQRTVRGQKKTIGNYCRIKIKKNRFVGEENVIQIPIYYRIGFDDISSCIEFLLTWKHWKQKQGIIKAKEFKYKGDLRGLIRRIEKRNLEKDLSELVGDVWNEIQDESNKEFEGRKNKYE